MSQLIALRLVRSLPLLSSRCPKRSLRRRKYSKFLPREEVNGDWEASMMIHLPPLRE